MGIRNEDLVWLQSERNTDDDDGGGGMTATPVPDGEAGAIVPPPDDIALATGRVVLRKVYAGLLTAGTETLWGSYAFLSRPPDSEDVVVTLHDGGGAYERAEAIEWVQSYLVPSVEADAWLWGDQPQGIQQVRLLQHPDRPLPGIGDTLVLSVEDPAYPVAEQPIRITDMDYEVRSFNVANCPTDFELRDLTLYHTGIPLDQLFPGGSVGCMSEHDSPTLVRTTVAGGLATYYGAMALAEDATDGAKTLKVTSPYAQIVPSARSETNLQDESAGDDVTALVPAGVDGNLSLTHAIAITTPGGSVVVYLGRGIIPGTLSVVLGTQTLEEASDGTLTGVGDTDPGQWSGFIDRRTGALTLTHEATWSGNAVISAQPAAPLTAVAHTTEVEITEANRRRSYSIPLAPIPAPGTLRLTYIWQGQRLVMYDPGTGILAGDGSGTVDFATGTAAVTLAEYPDVDTSLVLQHASDVHTDARDADGSVQDPAIEHTLALAPRLASLALSWISGGEAKSATTDASGTLSGDATGFVRLGDKRLLATLSALPDEGEDITVDYQDGTPHHHSGTPTKDGSGFVTLTLPGAPIDPDSLIMRWTTKRYAWYPYTQTDVQQTARYDGAGGLEGCPGSTVNASTGEVTFKPERTYTVRTYSPASGWGTHDITDSFENGSTVTADYYVSTAPDGAAQQETISAPDLHIDLATTTADALLPWSLDFHLNGHRYIDRDGSLYQDPDPDTNAGVLAGSIDYAARRVTVSEYAGGGSASLTVNAAATARGDWTIQDIVHITAGAPLAPASYVVQATTPGGTPKYATTDATGAISGDGTTGQVDQTHGIARVTFDEEVVPSTVRYNATVTSWLPLPAELLQVDPTLLPPDGRVLVIKPAGLILVHDTASEQLADPVAGATENLARGDLWTLRILDADGVPLTTSVWDETYTTSPAVHTIKTDYGTLDLQHGSLTWADPLPDLSGHPTPYTAEHRIASLRQVVQVEADGTLTLAQGLSHTYPAASAVVSSLLPMGHRYARVANLYDGTTWQGEWSDELVGDEPPSAEYNALQYPVAVTNEGAVDEEWALVFVSSTNLNVVGRTLGVIGQFSILSDIAPVNPLTGKVYFSIPSGGWGTGWSSGNYLHLETISAARPVWVMVTQHPAEQGGGDSFRIEQEGRA